VKTLIVIDAQNEFSNKGQIERHAYIREHHGHARHGSRWPDCEVNWTEKYTRAK
jgi:hypothetical protein